MHNFTLCKLHPIKLYFLECYPLNSFVARLGTVAMKQKEVVKKKTVKDPSIKEGLPLPENGTCKHYKKSFRWLRYMYICI